MMMPSRSPHDASGSLYDINIVGTAADPRDTIKDGVAFSHRLVVTYHWLLLSLVFASAAVHHLTRLYRWRSAHRSEQVEGAEPLGDDHRSEGRGQTAFGGASSSSSSSSENLTAVQKETPEIPHEITPLLPRSTQAKRTPAWRRSLRKARAIPMYHPVTLRDIPANDTIFLVALLLIVNLFYTYYKISFQRPLVFVLADRAGLLFTANLPWLYLLSAKNQPFRLLHGSSYESLNILHRSLGRWLAFLAIVHFVGMVLVWYDFLLPAGLDLWWFLSRYLIWTGLTAFTCYITLTLTSLLAFRQWCYELFLACHVLLQAGGLLFLFLHHTSTRINVGTALAIFLVDHIFYRWALKTRSFQANLSVLDDGQTLMVSAQWPLQPRWPRLLEWTLGRNVCQGWDTCDHIFLTVPALGKKHVIQAHPFTIASSAPDCDHHNARLNLIIRARDGFTRDLLNYAHTHSTAVIRLDGPYGSPSAYEMLARNDRALIVAGGSGIAVAYPLLWHLLGNRSKTSLDAQSARQRVSLIWIIHDDSHVAWIGQERLDELQSMGLEISIPPATSLAGRPNARNLVRDAVYSLVGQHNDPSVGVVVSGPDAMNRTVRNTCSQLAWNGMNIQVAVEVFDW